MRNWNGHCVDIELNEHVEKLCNFILMTRLSTTIISLIQFFAVKFIICTENSIIKVTVHALYQNQ